MISPPWIICTTLSNGNTTLFSTPHRWNQAHWLFHKHIYFCAALSTLPSDFTHSTFLEYSTSQHVTSDAKCSQANQWNFKACLEFSLSYWMQFRHIWAFCQLYSDEVSPCLDRLQCVLTSPGSMWHIAPWCSTGPLQCFKVFSTKPIQSLQISKVRWAHCPKSNTTLNFYSCSLTSSSLTSLSEDEEMDTPSLDNKVAENDRPPIQPNWCVGSAGLMQPQSKPPMVTPTPTTLPVSMMCFFYYLMTLF